MSEVLSLDNKEEYVVENEVKGPFFEPKKDELDEDAETRTDGKYSLVALDSKEELKTKSTELDMPIYPEKTYNYLLIFSGICMGAYIGSFMRIAFIGFKVWSIEGKIWM